jgi:archaellum component FlaG (FlaF/FlaG flagellin family)
MKSKKVLWIVLGVILIIELIGAGWVYNMNKNNQLAKSNAEIRVLIDSAMALQQQLGVTTATENIIRVDPNKIFVTVVNTSDNITHILLEINGIWGQFTTFGH